MNKIVKIKEFTFEFNDIPSTGLYQFWATNDYLDKKIINKLKNSKCELYRNINLFCCDKPYLYTIFPPPKFIDMPKDIYNREKNKLFSFMGYEAEDIIILYNEGKSD